MDIASLREIGSLVNFGTDEIIVQQGEIGEEMFILLKGNVEVVINSEFVGNEVKIAELKTGDAFGEMSMIEDKSRSATVRAVNSCTVFKIHKDHFTDYIMKDSTEAIKILKILSNRLVEIKERTKEKAQEIQEDEEHETIDETVKEG